MRLHAAPIGPAHDRVPRERPGRHASPRRVRVGRRRQAGGTAHPHHGGHANPAAQLAGGRSSALLPADGRTAAIEAFERALALSPSSAFTLFAGSALLAYAGEAERAIEWAERALRISPNDRLNYFAHHAFALAHFLRGRYPDAAVAARRAVDSNPGFSVSHSLLVAPLVKLGRLEEAKAETVQVLSLQPSFSAGGFCAGLALPAVLADPLAKAWREAGLPP